MPENRSNSLRLPLGAEDDGGGIDASLFAFKPPSLSGECASRVCGEGAIRCEELTAEGDEFAGLVFRPVCRHDLFCRTRSGFDYKALIRSAKSRSDCILRCS